MARLRVYEAHAHETHGSALPAILLPMIAFRSDCRLRPRQAESALRARVTEFLQYHVDGNFRKAYDMVAEDTKDEYFNSGKAQLESFKIDDDQVHGQFHQGHGVRDAIENDGDRWARPFR